MLDYNSLLTWHYPSKVLYISALRLKDIHHFSILHPINYMGMKNPHLIFLINFLYYFGLILNSNHYPYEQDNGLNPNSIALCNVKQCQHHQTNL